MKKTDGGNWGLAAMVTGGKRKRSCISRSEKKVRCKLVQGNNTGGRNRCRPAEATTGGEMACRKRKLGDQERNQHQNEKKVFFTAARKSALALCRHKGGEKGQDERKMGAT